MAEVFKAKSYGVEGFEKVLVIKRIVPTLAAHPEFVEPEFRRNEVVQFIRQGLRDMTITRKAAGWGIPVPDDPGQVIYIWFDALINYITACGYPNDGAEFQRWWPADWHLIGKDILVRFHATLWPAMLLGAGIPLPRQIFGHGHLTIEGEKTWISVMPKMAVSMLPSQPNFGSGFAPHEGTPTRSVASAL